MEYKNKQTVAKCLHCSNETLMNVKDVYKKESDSIDSDSYYYDMTIVLFCPVCKSYNIINAYWDHSYGNKSSVDEYDIYNGDNVEEKHLYPNSSNLIKEKSKFLPDTVLNNFSSSIELKNVDKESCLMKLRKTLEMICEDKKASGNNLYDKIENLSSIGVLPSTLNSASTLARKLGNIGVHDADINISKEELENVIELVEYIIRYIYVLPKEIEILAKKFNFDK